MIGVGKLNVSDTSFSKFEWEKCLLYDVTQFFYHGKIYEKHLQKRTALSCTWLYRYPAFWIEQTPFLEAKGTLFLLVAKWSHLLCLYEPHPLFNWTLPHLEAKIFKIFLNISNINISENFIYFKYFRKIYYKLYAYTYFLNLLPLDRSPFLSEWTNRPFYPHLSIF